MRGFAGSLSIAAVLLWTAQASADPMVFQPEGCDFQLSFPAAPSLTQQKQTTNRGDAVVTDKAELHLDVGGKANILRAECSKIPHMGFMDEAILSDNMRDLADAYKLQSPGVAILHNRLAGSIGRLHARARSGGKDITLEIYRYTSADNIFDVWIGAEPDGFPSDATTAFLKSIKLNGQDIP